ncbi:PREDICTED: type IV inositol polyphosphate 5-phosphatase 9 isoform X2 [Camelina sativa]|uniref:Type IV inositol polyphosphate 5-phosphatase 9 isoform X2 n=1 Tax=Camelina sativa TaxID=90675 RepID=A0ABM0TE02_CAMSA|nr:PREDICTED: type IV inositol polyphosphate 5-phosphatase 9 isoform X2 [Camelina sativa]
MLGSYREVMWPRLVANKILRKSVGSNNFVADFPPDTDQKLLEASGLLDERPSFTSKSILLEQHKTTHLNYKVFASTWNVGGIVPDDGLDMDDLLETHKTPCDIYVLGFQEVVPLRASNVLGPDNNKVSAKWNSLIRETLNKGVAEPHRDKDVSESKGTNSISQDFRCIISKQMVGILITVWVRGDLWPYIRHPSVSCVGCGIMGCLGNKGSVSVRFQLHETTFCFVCCHLASGGRDRDERQRNSDVNEILARSSFPRGSSLDLPKKILDHDRVIFLGDLNYRISLPEEKTRLLVKSKEWNILLENDQIFRGWQEGIVMFAPTYKYIPNSDLYYGCITYQKDEKKRAPAWCDRIIWYGSGLKQHEYARGETKISDHRPVKAIFTAEVTVIRHGKKIRNLFFSDRFEETIDVDAKDYSWIST